MKSRISWYSKKAAGRRRNNLRSEVITLFRYAQNRLRALPRDRKTEAELVDKVKAKGKSIETMPHLRVLGKGSKVRYVPAHPLAPERIHEYLQAAAAMT
jgi:hypothetical protein